MSHIATGIYNTRATLERSVKALAAEGRSNREIGKATGVSFTTAQRILEQPSKAEKPKPPPKLVTSAKEFNKMWHIATPQEN